MQEWKYLQVKGRLFGKGYLRRASEMWYQCDDIVMTVFIITINKQ